MHRLAPTKVLRVLLAALAVAGLFGCQAQPPQAAPTPAVPAAPAQTVTPLAATIPQPDYWPTEEWKTSTPEQQGMDSAQLAAMFDAVEAKKLNLHSVLIIRNGYLVTEAYFGPYTPDMRHQVMSVTKSVTAMLTGIAIARGRIKGVDEPVLSFFGDREIRSLDQRKRDMTLEHLLTLTTGLNCSDSASTLAQMFQSADWVQFTLDISMATAPGKQFWYCSPAVHLLSAILEAATGKNEREFANENLFQPLGIAPAGPGDWAADPQGRPEGFGGLALTPRDMARLGFLYLHGGAWDGQQVVPAEWVSSSLRPHTTEENSGRGYGYLTWLYPEQGYASMMGLGGQDIHIIPSGNMVVVFTSAMNIPTHDKEAIDLLDRYIVPAARSTEPLPENTAAAAELQARISRAAAPPPVAPSAAPAAARPFSGKTYKMESNVNGWKTFALTFEDGSPEAIMTIDGAGKVAIGLDNAWRTTDVPSTGKVALRGQWQEDGTLAFDADTLGSAQLWRYRLSLGQDLKIEGKEEVSGAAYTMTGHLAP